jgi:hypothetical protein
MKQHGVILPALPATLLTFSAFALLCPGLPCAPQHPVLDGDERPAKSTLPERLEEVLWWLPEDTQTLVVSQGRLELPPLRQDRDALPSFEDSFLSLAAVPLVVVEKGAVYKTLAGSKVSLCVEGSRRFRAPKGLGMMSYEGCHILMFDDGSTGRVDTLMEALTAKVLRTETCEGHSVALFETRQESGIWTSFIIYL